MPIRLTKTPDGRLHTHCDTCQHNQIALTINEARNDAIRHRQWHLQKTGQ